MTSAFVFLNCDPRLVQAAKSELESVSNATAVYETSGIYDIIIKVDAKSEESLRDTIVKIRTLPGMTCTTTTIIAAASTKARQQ
jgi:DNA-binding Lrp family transcriptional regulator